MNEASYEMTWIGAESLNGQFSSREKIAKHVCNSRIVGNSYKKVRKETKDLWRSEWYVL